MKLLKASFKSMFPRAVQLTCKIIPRPGLYRGSRFIKSFIQLARKILNVTAPSPEVIQARTWDDPAEHDMGKCWNYL